MKLQTKALREELAWVNRFVKSKSTIPILKNVLFEAHGDSNLTLTGTDLEVSGITAIACQDAETWAVAAPVKKLIQYLAKVEEPEVTVKTNKDCALLLTHGGHGDLSVNGMSKESFPGLPVLTDKRCTLRGLPLAVSRTNFCVSKKESRFALNGSLLEISKGVARMAATDGHRMSLAPLTAVGADETLDFKMLLPKLAWLEASALDGDCVVSTDEEHAQLDFGQRQIVTRRLKGNFPDIDRVVIKELANHIIVPAASMLKALNRVALYADERSHAVKFAIGSNGVMTMTAITIEEGAASATIACHVAEIAAPVELGYNADYVMEFLSRATDNQFAAFAWVDPKTPGQFYTMDGWKYIVMPMRLA